MPPSDPTDEALAAIASILDHSPSPRSYDDAPTTTSPPTAPIEADGYSKIGPGPMAAIRFKWRARRDGERDAYYVDELIGEGSTALTIGGPLSAEAAIKLVDTRESEARDRFEAIRREMTSSAASGDVPHTDEE